MTLIKILFGFVVVFLLWGLFWNLPVNGWHHQTGSGEHVGYVTAVEKLGIFFKTNRAYIKTDTQSSQENAYCVENEATYEKLRSFAETKTHIKVYYTDYIGKGLKYCSGESDVIVDVSAL